jgi:hypothetical protein
MERCRATKRWFFEFGNSRLLLEMFSHQFIAWILSTQLAKYLRRRRNVQNIHATQH